MHDVGFIILTHNNSTQALRLLKTLNCIFNYPPIVWHHDFSKSNFPTKRLSSNVLLVDSYVKTSWGSYSLVEAKLRALSLLYSGKGPDYYITLSGADYPVKDAKGIVCDLKKGQYDAYIRSTLIDYYNLDKEWHKQYYKRYCSTKVLFRRKNKSGLDVVSQVTLLKHPLIARFFTPFNKETKCWGGEFWYTGTRKSAKFIMNHIQEDPLGLVDHYKRVKIPDESIFQTILKNTASLKCSNDNKRYIDWSGGNPHPKTLELCDFNSIQSSGAHFARKFDQNKSLSLINAIDNQLLGI